MLSYPVMKTTWGKSPEGRTVRYKIVVDSCCDLNEGEKRDPHIERVPLILQVGRHSFIDDDTFNQKEFLRTVAESPECAKTACPSPEAYLKTCEGDCDMVFIVTLSRHLSGSYNSAVLAKALYEEEHPGEGKRIEVVSSDSAACGESVIALRLREFAEAGLGFEEIAEKIRKFRGEMVTYFVLENLDTLKKNGRLTGLAAILATTMNIKPVMAGDHGVIVKVDQTRGIQKALRRMADRVVENCRNPEEKTLGITHVNCPERAAFVRDLLLSKAHFRDVYLVEAAGVSTTYANDGGIVVAC